MLARVVATPVLGRLAVGDARGTVRSVSGGAAYLDLDGFVVALTADGVPLMPNGVAVERVPTTGGVARARPGLIELEADAITWDPDGPPGWEPALRRARPDEREALARRGVAILAALDGDVAVTATGRGREGAEHLRRALAARDAAAAERASERLLGLGGGLTPEGDDVLAATAAVVAAVGDAAGFRGADRERWLAALVPADCHERTTGLSATLLELAAHGRIAAPVHPLVDPGAARWREALAQLESAGASTGRAYAVAVGETLRALVS
jgi:Protein of unknown function (DUF2877)